MMLSKPVTSPRDIVLLIDDSPEALGFLTEALEQSGYTVLIATSGTTALSIAERITPDIILLDAVMPGMDGFQTCQQLKGSNTVSQVPVLFMTGLTETEHVVRALECGGVDYLTKPINVDELRARIKVHLGNARSAQSARVALDAAGRHLLAVRSDGSIQWTTPQASKLLSDTLGSEDAQSTIRERLSAWFSQRSHNPASDPAIQIQISGKTLLQMSFLGAIGPDEHLFRLTAANDQSGDQLLRAHFALTGRESEVLLWIAKGKSNKDIGDILGLSARTVNKHLEQVYVKLGVENRASAAVRAAHILHEV
jgi:DNA-binding response OmpR family regulator